ncbi:MAG: hypothetical protein E6789_08280 [Clostridium baratii]|nr:hypothetical protein [Clostridium baratii]
MHIKVNTPKDQQPSKSNNNNRRENNVSDKGDRRVVTTSLPYVGED